jgi:DinB superfamily
MMAGNQTAVLRRPLVSEYAPFYETYVGKVTETDVLAVLRAQNDSTLAFLDGVPAAKVDFSYAPGKWTLRQVVGHVIDMEWVFVSRALHFARAVPGELPGVDQDEFMKVVDFAARPWASLGDEYRHLRAAGIRFFEGLDEAAWSRGGIASGNPVTVRALAYIIAGHERHHFGVVRERYLD